MNETCPECGKLVERLKDGRFARHRAQPGIFCPLGVSKEEAAGSQGSKKKRKTKGKRAPRVCPTHGHALVAGNTQYGRRYACPEFGCTVVQWAGSTSTPADQPTRAARMKAHAAFDNMWDYHVPGSRSKAYKALSEFMELPPSKCHIGMFDAEQCERVVEFADKFVLEPTQ